MNKYQDALNNVKIAPSFMGGNDEYRRHLDSSVPFLKDIAILQELVDKETEYQSLEKENQELKEKNLKLSIENHNSKIVEEMNKTVVENKNKQLLEATELNITYVDKIIMLKKTIEILKEYIMYEELDEILEKYPYLKEVLENE